jgi:hypothetical protein
MVCKRSFKLKRSLDPKSVVDKRRSLITLLIQAEDADVKAVFDS